VTPGTAGEAAASHTHRRSFRGYEGYAYPHFLKWGYCTPTFKCYKRPSFELKLHRNAWVAAGGACSTPPDPLARLRALHLKGRGGKEMEGGRGGAERKRGKERGSGTPTFGRKLRPCTHRHTRIGQLSPLPAAEQQSRDGSFNVWTS